MTQLRGVSTRVTRVLERLAIKVEDEQRGELWALSKLNHPWREWYRKKSFYTKRREDFIAHYST